MMKKVILWLALVLLPLIALADVQVIDDAGALTASEEASITAAIEAVEKAHQVDLVVLVTRETPYDGSESLWRVRDFADDYYDNGGYGMGPDQSGLLYLIDLNNRVQWISTGGVMIDYITDYREELILDAAETYLFRSDWARAALAAVQRTGEFMDQGREKGSFRYDEVTGERLSGLYNPLESFEVLLAAGAGAAAAGIFVAAVSGAYNLKGSTYRYEMNQNSTCTFTLDHEVFLRENVSRMARASSSGGGGGGGSRSGGSGVHRSSSGRSHGGGGRRF